MKITFIKVIPLVLLIINIIIAIRQSNIHSLIGWSGMLIMLIMFYIVLDGWEKDVKCVKQETEDKDGS